MNFDTDRADGGATRHPDIAEETLLARLRRETRASHTAVEAAFAPHLDDMAAGLSGFLAAQDAAFRALAGACDGELPEEPGRMMAALLDDLAQDCAAHGASPPRLSVPVALHPAAISYLLTGSRMGAAIISRRLTKAGLNVPRAFRDVETGGAWRAVASDLTARPAAGGCSDRIVADVLRGYALFAEAAQTSHRVAA